MLLEVLETPRKILRRDDHGQPSPSASTGTVMRTRALAVYHFSKDSRTGRRKTHCQYRPRSSAAASKNVLQLTDVGLANDTDVLGINTSINQS